MSLKNPIMVASGTFGHSEKYYNLEEVKRLTIFELFAEHTMKAISKSLKQLALKTEQIAKTLPKPEKTKPAGKPKDKARAKVTKESDTASPMRLDLGANSAGSRLVSKDRKTLYGTDFPMLCIDMYDVKRRQGDELAARQARKVAI